MSARSSTVAGPIGLKHKERPHHSMGPFLFIRVGEPMRDFDLCGRSGRSKPRPYATSSNDDGLARASGCQVHGVGLLARLQCYLDALHKPSR